MKSIYFLFLSLFFFISCGDDDLMPPVEEEPSPYWGEISALKNGEPWTASIYATINDTHGAENWLHLIVSLFDETDIPREGLSFVKIPIGTGTYPVFFADIQEDDGKAGALHSILDFDVLLAAYYPIERDSTNVITISEYDEASGEVKGAFEVIFVVDWKSESSFPDTVRFTNGVFHTRIWEE